MADTFLAVGKRVRLRLSDASLLSRGEEKRHHFKVELDLSAGNERNLGDVLIGLPEWILNAYNHKVKTANHGKRETFEVTLENMAIEMYATPKGRKMFSIITGATVGNFVMVRTGKTDEDVQVTLLFSLYFAGRKEIHDWTYESPRGDFFASFEQQQGELDLDGTQPTEGAEASDEEEVDEEDDEEDEEDEDEHEDE